MGAARILLVDDDVHVLRAVRRALFGYDVRTATSGAEALDRVARGEEFDAVICDVHMPDMDGRDFVVHLEAAARALADKVLFLTVDAAVVKGSGHPVLTKPFDTHVLRSHVEPFFAKPARSGGHHLPAADGASSERRRRRRRMKALEKHRRL